jgi:UDP-glucose 4-epimerase
LSIYGVHKLAGEKYYRFYQEAYSLSTVSVRIANPYGPRQQMKHSKYGIVNWFIRLALEGHRLRYSARACSAEITFSMET